MSKNATASLWCGNSRFGTSVERRRRRTARARFTDGTLLRRIKPGLRVTTFVYDRVQRATEVADPLGWITTTTYTPSGMTASVVEPTGDTTQFAYDEADRQVTHTNAAGQVTRSVYDAANRRIAVRSPIDGVTTTQYDCLDRPTAVINAVGCVTARSHDAAGGEKGNAEVFDMIMGNADRTKSCKRR